MNILAAKRLRACSVSLAAILAFYAPSSHAGSGTFHVVTKSYIARIGTNLGYLSTLILPGRREAFVALAKVTDADFSENPQNTLRDRQYRMFSDLTVRASCSAGRATVTRAIATDVGLEAFGSVTPPALRANVRQTQVGNQVELSWVVWGHPALRLEASFQLIKPRLNTNIWHKLKARVVCSALNMPVMTVSEFRGSKFPTHRYWLNGALRSTDPQGSFSDLWSLEDVPSP